MIASKIKSIKQWAVRKWDRWIYFHAAHTLRRMTLEDPGMAYLMELQIKEWNERLNISAALRNATEVFHESLRRTEKPR